MGQVKYLQVEMCLILLYQRELLEPLLSDATVRKIELLDQ